MGCCTYSPPRSIAPRWAGLIAASDQYPPARQSCAPAASRTVARASPGSRGAAREAAPGAGRCRSPAVGLRQWAGTPSRRAAAGAGWAPAWTWHTEEMAWLSIRFSWKKQTSRHYQSLCLDAILLANIFQHPIISSILVFQELVLVQV